LTTLDHLVYGVASLEAGAGSLAGSFGIRATAGGKHLGRGTHNALISLGDVSYLELIAPDPEQELPALGLPFGLERLGEPRLVGWAFGTEHIDELVERARARRYDPGAIESMERVRPDGIRLRWRPTRPPSRQKARGLVKSPLDSAQYLSWTRRRVIERMSWSRGFGPRSLFVPAPGCGSPSVLPSGRFRRKTWRWYRHRCRPPAPHPPWGWPDQAYSWKRDHPHGNNAQPGSQLNQSILVASGPGWNDAASRTDEGSKKAESP